MYDFFCTPEKTVNRFTPEYCFGGSAGGVGYQSKFCLISFLDICVSTGKLLSGQPAIAIEDFSASRDNSILFWLASSAGCLAQTESYFHRQIATAKCDIALERVNDSDKHYFNPAYETYLVTGKDDIARFFAWLTDDCGFSLVTAHQDFLNTLLEPELPLSCDKVLGRL